MILTFLENFFQHYDLLQAQFDLIKPEQIKKSRRCCIEILLQFWLDPIILIRVKKDREKQTTCNEDASY